MKRLTLFALALIVSLGLVSATFAQTPALVQQSGSRLDAATRCDSATSTTQVTLTAAAPGAGLSNYTYYLGIWGLASGLVTTATPTQSTATGLATVSTAGFTPLASTGPTTGGAATTGHVAGGPLFFPTGLKSAAATANTFVGPTAITNMTQVIQACYNANP